MSSLPGAMASSSAGVGARSRLMRAIAAEVVRIVASFKDTGRVPNVVNLARRTPATTCWSSAIGTGRASSRTCSSTSASHINVQETENIVFEGAEAAIARINVDRAPSQAELDAIAPGNDDILSVQLVGSDSPGRAGQVAVRAGTAGPIVGLPWGETSP